MESYTPVLDELSNTPFEFRQVIGWTSDKSELIMGFLTDQTAVITAASSGICKPIALGLAAQGT